MVPSSNVGSILRFGLATLAGTAAIAVGFLQSSRCPSSLPPSLSISVPLLQRIQMPSVHFCLLSLGCSTAILYQMTQCRFPPRSRLDRCCFVLWWIVCLRFKAMFILSRPLSGSGFSLYCNGSAAHRNSSSFWCYWSKLFQIWICCAQPLTLKVL